MILPELLRSQVLREIFERIMDGRFPAGTRIKETALSKELGVSRTPIREALLGLERDGLLTASARRGFTVKSFSAEEVEETYTILATLDALALKLSGPDLLKEMDPLTDVNQKIARSRDDPELLVQLDRQWHGLMLQHCPNRRLRTMISKLKQQALRYEMAYMRGIGDIATSVNQHREIIQLLDRQRFEEACHMLKQHWLNSIPPLVVWLNKP